MLGCKVLQIGAMHVVAKMSPHSVIFLKFFNDFVTTPSEEYDHRHMAEVYIGLQAAVHGSGIPFQKLMKIMNILHEI
jgi:hypothetical protein